MGRRKRLLDPHAENFRQPARSHVQCNNKYFGSGPGELSCSGTNKRLGGTVGAGIEYGFMPNCSAKIEYLYTAAAALEASRLNEVRVGVNYRFGGL